MKLNILLARVDELANVFRRNLEDYVKFFKSSQGAFKGIRKTYVAKDGEIDDPSKREFKVVQTTAREKWEWLRVNNRAYIDALFSVEKTNASGTAKAHLIVDGVDWGEFTSLELMRLKGLLSDANLIEMISTIPVRSDEVEWEKSDEDMYKNKEVYETKEVKSIVKTTLKQGYIMSDPNVALLKDSAGYKPQIATVDTIKELGEATLQHFTGEWSHRERAETLARRQRMLMAVIEALKTANEAEAVYSELNVTKIFDFLQEGKQPDKKS